MVKKQILLLTAAAVLLLTSCKSVTSDNGQATAAKKTPSGGLADGNSAMTSRRLL